MDKPQTVSVRVAGRAYTLRTTLDRHAIDRAVAYLNRRLKEVRAASPGADGETAAIAAALSLAGELVSAQDDNTRLMRQLSDIHERTD